MRALFLFFILLLVAGFCFAQDVFPGKIIGSIPDARSTKLYQIQVGSFSVEANADNAVLRLQNNGLCPVKERYQNFTRVIIKEIPANQVRSILAIIGRSGFTEVMIQENVATSVIIPAPVPSPAPVPAPAPTPAPVTETAPAAATTPAPVTETAAPAVEPTPAPAPVEVIPEVAEEYEVIYFEEEYIEEDFEIFYDFDDEEIFEVFDFEVLF